MYDAHHPILSEDGFLIDREAWTPELARALAAKIPLVLQEDHFEIIRFIRAYHERFDHLPTNRLFIKAVEKALGPEKGNSRHLNQLLAGTPVRTACLIAGLPKPPGCL